MGNYLLNHSQKLSEKYPGKYVAIAKNRLVAVSKSGFEAYKKAKEKNPTKEVSIAYIPTKKELVHLL